ncbi:MAG: cytochrome c oxidase subunit II [Pirellulaceae bacterium]|nr:cytochrome c oxidase subunit II [Pirellulaceae bacterium]MDP6721402.1 cytochrome c oxidase subunit II [Pirellulaceae bacterium]
MGRFWSILFLLVPVLGVLTFVCAIADIWPMNGGAYAFPGNNWLPENVNDHGHVIDRLFTFILYLTGTIFVGTSSALFWFMWKFDAARNPNPVEFTHGSHNLEIIWSILPAATLLFIAIYQMNAWADAKLNRPEEVIAGRPVPQRPLVRVTGRQFEWRLQYAGADRELGTRDDIFLVNDLHIPLDQEVVIQLESEDVLHSFFLPNLRIKQDVVPGMRQFTWFRANKAGVYDIVCAELCGWGHYKMRGRLTIEPEDQFNKWLAQKFDEQEFAGSAPDSGE